MKNLSKRVKAIFAKPERKLTAVRLEFQRLRLTLQVAVSSDDPLSMIDRFFDSMSKWHDRGINDLIAALEEVNYCQYDEVLEKLRILQKHFENAGRDEHGMNRTKRGETVTADRVFLGDIYGLWTRPVPFWKQVKDEAKGGWGHSGMEHLNAYDVVALQARNFMASHASPMIAIIDRLEVIAP